MRKLPAGLIDGNVELFSVAPFKLRALHNGSLVDFGQLPARVLAAMSELVEQLLGCPSSDVEGAVFGDIYMAVYRQHSESLSDKPAEKNRRKTSFCDGFYHHYAL